MDSIIVLLAVLGATAVLAGILAFAVLSAIASLVAPLRGARRMHRSGLRQPAR